MGLGGWVHTLPGKAVGGCAFSALSAVAYLFGAYALRRFGICDVNSMCFFDGMSRMMGLIWCVGGNFLFGVDWGEGIDMQILCESLWCVVCIMLWAG